MRAAEHPPLKDQGQTAAQPLDGASQRYHTSPLTDHSGSNEASASTGTLHRVLRTKVNIHTLLVPDRYSRDERPESSRLLLITERVGPTAPSLLMDNYGSNRASTSRQGKASTSLITRGRRSLFPPRTASQPTRSSSLTYNSGDERPPNYQSA